MRQTRYVDGFGDAKAGDAAGFFREQAAAYGVLGQDAGLFGGGEFVLVREAAGFGGGAVEEEFSAALTPDPDDGHALGAFGREAWVGLGVAAVGGYAKEAYRTDDTG